MKRDKVTLLISGDGGHAAELNSLLAKLLKAEPNSNGKYIHIGNKIKANLKYKYQLRDIRHKSSNLITLFYAIPLFIYNILLCTYISTRFDVRCVISTGPGICIIPSVFFKFFFKSKIIFFESNCMFFNKSSTGKVMQHICDKFFVQNEELLKIYPEALYKGKL